MEQALDIGGHSSPPCYVPKPGLHSNRCPLEESLLQPLLNARVISRANSQPKAAWHALSLIREDRGCASKDCRDFN